MVEQAKTTAKTRHSLIDWLKTQTPFWKLEELPEGAAARWSEEPDKAAE